MDKPSPVMEVVILSKKTLISYASRYGSTKEIAMTIGEVLESHKLAVDVFSSEKIGSLSPYHSVVLGSAVYLGYWLESASELLESFQEQLAHMPVWLFSSGPTVNADPSKALDGWRFPVSLQATVDDIKPQGIKLFAGKIDASSLTHDNWLAIRSMDGNFGDYRDWDIITEWANDIAKSLNQNIGISKEKNSSVLGKGKNFKDQ